jgi:hypothetical protein
MDGNLMVSQWWHSITKVDVHNGVSTSFWKDHWLPTGPISLSHPALFSHTTRPNVSVFEVFQNRFELHLRPRLTCTAQCEQANLLLSLQDVHLDNSSDVRLLLLTGKKFRTKDAYSALAPSSGQRDLISKQIWGSAVPNKVKIFAWLYFKDRLSSRANLLQKHVLQDDVCQRCNGCVEDRHHIFFGCTSIISLWTMLGLSAVTTTLDDEVWALRPPCNLDIKLWPSVLMTLLWRLWDARNGDVFRGEQTSVTKIITRVTEDLATWKKRFVLRRAGTPDSIHAWLMYLDGCKHSVSPISLVPATSVTSV